MHQQNTGATKKMSEIKYRSENMQDKVEQLEGGYRKGNSEEEIHRKIKATYMTPQGWKPPEGLPLIKIGANIYIKQAP